MRTKSLLKLGLALALGSLCLRTETDCFALASPASPSANNALDANADARLMSKTTLDADSVSLEQVFKNISKSAGVDLRVDEEISQRRIFAKCTNQHLSSVMEAILAATKLTWEKSIGTTKKPQYLLKRSLSQTKEEARLIGLSISREKIVLEKLIEAEREALIHPKKREMHPLFQTCFFR